MRAPTFLLALVFMFAEIAGFILVGQAVGVLATLALTLLGMVGGVALLRRHGVATMRQVKAEIAARRQPARPLVDGAVLALAALFLILPGFLSDVAGLVLFIPAVRRAIWTRVARAAERKAAQRGAFRRVPEVTLDLQRGDYATTDRSGSPWRRDPGHQE